MHDGNWAGGKLVESEEKSIKHLAKMVVDQLGAGRSKEDIVRELHGSGWDPDEAKEFVERLVANRSEAAFDFRIRYPDMQPTNKGPVLFLINGIGAMLYGARDHDREMGTYVKTWCVSIVFVPVFALRAYRVVKGCDREAWYVIGKVPLSRTAKAWNLAVVLSILGVIGYASWRGHVDTAQYRAKQRMHSADQALASGDLVKASRLYEQVAVSPTKLARVARAKLVTLSQNAEIAKLSHDDTIQLFQCISGAVPLDDADSPVFRNGTALVKQWASTAPQDSVLLLRTIARISGPMACQVLNNLIQESFRNLPEKDVLPVYTTALSIATGAGARKAVVQGALRWAEEHGSSVPHTVLRITELAFEPAEVDSKQLETLQFQALKQIVKAEPGNTDMAVRYALLLEKRNKMDEAELLLLPIRGRLSDTEGARILGQILAAKGVLDEAFAVLSPYVESRLAELHDAEQGFGHAISVAQGQAIQRLRTGYAAPFDYDKYKLTVGSAKDEMVAQFVRQYVKKQNGVIRAREVLAGTASVVPVALDLGIVILRRAQNISDPVKRESELKKAEKTFLEIRGVAGDNDAFLLNMGQVYYWLGKQKEGKQQLDQLLTKHDRSGDALVAVADVLHQIGADAEAKQLAEEAYGKASDGAFRFAAAQRQVLLSTTLQDRITWLSRCDPRSPQTRADLLEVRGLQAARQGHDEEAVKYYKDAVTILDAMPETGSILNNSAIMCLSVFSLTGNRKALSQAVARLEKAVLLSPSHPFVLRNAANVLQLSALEELAGSRLNLRSKNVANSLSLLAFLAADSTQMEQLRKRLGRNANMRKSLDYLDRALLLSPREIRIFTILVSIHSFLRDADALDRLLQRVQKVELERSYLGEQLEYYRGKVTAETNESLKRELDIATKTVRQSRHEGTHVRFAVAVAKLLVVSRRQEDLAQVDVDGLVRLAGEAHQAAPSLGSYATLRDALLLRAGRSLAKEHSQFAKAAEATRRSLGLRFSVVLVLARDDALGQAARENADVRRAASLLVEAYENFPKSPRPLDWALLHAVRPEKAETVAKYLRNDRVGRLVRKLFAVLYPFHVGAACETCWMHVINGQDPDCSWLDQIIEQGVPVPNLLLHEFRVSVHGLRP